MTEFIAKPNAYGLVKLSGTMQQLQVERQSASFVLTEQDQSNMGIIAIAAALAGQGGPAMSTASSASDMEEEARYLTFTLNDQPMKGWVWRNPFNEGDQVEVAAEWQNDHWELYGIARPSDRMIALYPHCARTPARHNLNTVKWWLILGAGGLFFGFIPLMMIITSNLEIIFAVEMIYALLGGMAFFALIAYSTSRQFMPLAQVSERIFRTLELPNAGFIDLVQSSKKQRTAQDKAEYGIFYFRY